VHWACDAVLLVLRTFVMSVSALRGLRCVISNEKMGFGLSRLTVLCEARDPM
jgi:hypothetical protein